MITVMNLIKFTMLKDTIQWFSVSSQRCATIITLSLDFHNPPKQTPVTVDSQSPESCSHLPHCFMRPLIYFLSL